VAVAACDTGQETQVSEHEQQQGNGAWRADPAVARLGRVVAELEAMGEEERALALGYVNGRYGTPAPPATGGGRRR